QKSLSSSHNLFAGMPFATSHRRRRPHDSPVARVLPSCDREADRTTPKSPSNVLLCFPLSTFHSSRCPPVTRVLAVISVLPSVEKAPATTVPFGLMVARARPFLEFHSTHVLSKVPEAMMSPLGENRAKRTGPACVATNLSRSFVSTFHTRMVLSLPAET